MNLYTEILKWKTKLVALKNADIFGAAYAAKEKMPEYLFVTLDENEDLAGKLPCVALEAGVTEGEYLSNGKFDIDTHYSTVHCIVSAQNVAFDEAATAGEQLATEAMKQLTGLKIQVKLNGVSRAGLLIGSEKARAVQLELVSLD